MTVPTWLEENVRALGYSSYDEYLAKKVYPNSFSGYIDRDTYGYGIYGVDDRYNAGAITNPAVLEVIEKYGVPQKAYQPSWDDPYFFQGLDQILNAVKDRFTMPDLSQAIQAGKTSTATISQNRNQLLGATNTLAQTTRVGSGGGGSSAIKYVPLAIGIGGIGLAIYGLFKW
ncbi:MAG: hypothetical protein GYA60_01555 [Candidatus Methanofastidiosa archaeon]|nr:hypothetical protein [Candidatus Methanofastidiosa archaeon]